jgi:hypothetical protein
MQQRAKVGQAQSVGWLHQPAHVRDARAKESVAFAILARPRFEEPLQDGGTLRGRHGAQLAAKFRKFHPAPMTALRAGVTPARGIT